MIKASTIKQLNKEAESIDKKIEKLQQRKVAIASVLDLYDDVDANYKEAKAEGNGQQIQNWAPKPLSKSGKVFYRLFSQEIQNGVEKVNAPHMANVTKKSLQGCGQHITFMKKNRYIEPNGKGSYRLLRDINGNEIFNSDIPVTKLPVSKANGYDSLKAPMGKIAAAK